MSACPFEGISQRTYYTTRRGDEMLTKYVRQLPTSQQRIIEEALRESVPAEYVEDGMGSRLCDLADTIDLSILEEETK
jgi:hypothetical protein